MTITPMRRLMSALLLVAIAADAAAECAPEKLVKVVYRDATPGIDKTSFAAKPQTLWRLGKDFGRVEEMPDPENGIHQLIVVNVRDAWMVNLLDKSGKHIVDHAETSGFVAPLVSGEELPAAVAEIEFGCEFQYMRARGAKPESVEMAGRKFRQFRVAEGHFVVKLIALPDQDVPFGFALLKDGATQVYFQYMEYGTSLDADPRLFARPEGITYSED